MSNIILCGLPGSGKSTIGQLVAQQLGRAFIDIDRMVEELDLFSRSCRQIAIEEGFEYFRQMEQKAVKQLKDSEKSVIATGGGTLIHEENQNLLKSLGVIIYLQGAPEILSKRILESGVPAYLDVNDPKNSFEALAATRHPIYLKVSHCSFSIDGLSPELVAEKILQFLKNSHLFI